MKAHHHIGHLHAGVIDVVLHFHALAARAQHTHEGVAQSGIAQMPDVRRFVGIDVGVLDDDLAACRGCFRGCGSEQSLPISGAVEADVDVSAAGHFQRRDTRNRVDPGRQLCSNLAGGLLQ
jgi:hypothetical protein